MDFLKFLQISFKIDTWGLNWSQKGSKETFSEFLLILETNFLEQIILQPALGGIKLTILAVLPLYF